jgi:hypothetical protein
MRTRYASAKAYVGERPDRDDVLGDLRFRGLIADEDWNSLPFAVRRRFSERVAGGHTVVFAGEVLETRMSAVGWCLAQATRLIGGPLPTTTDVHVPTVVTVTEDVATGGQIWTRVYARRRGFPQVIHSSKRFAGPTGLEEYVGRGIGMALTIAVEEGALTFRSNAYFLQIFGRRLRLPRWITPGALAVTHAELGEGRFRYTLEIVHPLFGMLIFQSAIFRDVEP